jgi:hypothetical protein
MVSATEIITEINRVAQSGEEEKLGDFGGDREKVAFATEIQAVFKESGWTRGPIVGKEMLCAMAQLSYTMQQSINFSDLINHERATRLKIKDILTYFRMVFMLFPLLTPTVFHIANVYIQRVSRKRERTEKVADVWKTDRVTINVKVADDWKKVIMTILLVAQKIQEDDSYLNWQFVEGMNFMNCFQRNTDVCWEEMNRWESNFLNAINWETFVKKEDLEHPLPSTPALKENPGKQCHSQKRLKTKTS